MEKLNNQEECCDYVTKRLNNKNSHNEYNNPNWSPLPSETIESNDTNWITVYPDIIVHKRWNNNDNLLIIEVKKEEYAKGEHKPAVAENQIKEYIEDLVNQWELSNEEIEEYKKDLKTNRGFDKIKIKEYMKQLKYKYWLYLEFNKEGVSEKSLLFTNIIQEEKLRQEEELP